MPLREVVNFTQYVTEDLIRCVEQVEALTGATPAGLKNSWGRDRDVEFVPYAMANSKRVNYGPNGAVTSQRRYVSEGLWGGTAFRIGLVDPRVAHDSPIAQLLGTDSTKTAPVDMVHQLVDRLTYIYPCPNDLRKIAAAMVNRGEVSLRFRAGLRSEKSENEKRLQRLMKARLKMEKVLVNYSLLARSGQEAQKHLKTLASHLKGADAHMVPRIADGINEVTSTAERVEEEVIVAIFNEMTAEALRLANTEV